METHLVVSIYADLWTCSWIEPHEIGRRNTNGTTEAIDAAAGDDPGKALLYAVAEAVLFYTAVTGCRPASVEIRHISNHARIAGQPFFVAYRSSTPPAHWNANDRAVLRKLGAFKLTEDILSKDEARRLATVSPKAAGETGVARLGSGLLSLALMAG